MDVRGIYSSFPWLGFMFVETDVEGIRLVFISVSGVISCGTNIASLPRDREDGVLIR